MRRAYPGGTAFPDERQIFAGRVMNTTSKIDLHLLSVYLWEIHWTLNPDVNHHWVCEETEQFDVVTKKVVQKRMDYLLGLGVEEEEARSPRGRLVYIKVSWATATEPVPVRSLKNSRQASPGQGPGSVGTKRGTTRFFPAHKKVTTNT